ncbi:hypothetical protein UFOVP849_13 [uncultured Caudovirales phage]|uniref:Uncharacterized protein n=1 Tax=uncultured Caudovirales phage TaxID=2100421 RepID=A0A6J5P2M9_9CAUD|nr:hypothetical protein UFOVP849_13 [uncultured Caudovirales phage]
MTEKKRIPPLKQVYWTAELKKVAIARLQGGISWAELIMVNDSVGLQPGVLLFDSLAAATAYIRQKNEDFAVVVELPVKSIEKELLVRCQEFGGTDLEFRQWIYPNHIWFDRVKFHKIETVAEEVDICDLAPQPVIASVLASSRDRPVIIAADGTISIPLQNP